MIGSSRNYQEKPNLPDLVLRTPFVKKLRNRDSRNYSLGKYYYKQSSVPNHKYRVELLDLEFVFKNKKVLNSKDHERDFKDIYHHLRRFATKKFFFSYSEKSSKYTPYSHCKYCFNEQTEFKRLNPGKNCCCKCGLPTVKYLYFEDDERFCIVCALMNKYHPRPHIRCLLHPSSHKGKSYGAMYVLYKEYYSISSASKAKKKTKNSRKLDILLTEQVWKLNSAIRFEYLYRVRRLIRKNFIGENLTNQRINDLIETRNEVQRKLLEIGPNMSNDWIEHDLEINLKGKKITKENKQMFFKNLRELYQELVQKIDDHLEYANQMRMNIAYQSNMHLNQQIQPMFLPQPTIIPMGPTPTMMQIRNIQSNNGEQYRLNELRFENKPVDSKNVKLKSIKMINCGNGKNLNGNITGKKRKLPPISEIVQYKGNFMPKRLKIRNDNQNSVGILQNSRKIVRRSLDLKAVLNPINVNTVTQLDLSGLEKNFTRNHSKHL